MHAGAELELIGDDEVKRIVERECADCGIPLLLTPPGEFVSLKHDYDLTLWKIAGTGLMVSSHEEAVKVVEFLSAISLWTTEYGSGYRCYEKIGKRADAPTTDGIMAKKLYSAEQFHKHKDVINQNAERKEYHEKAKKEYNDAESARRTVCERVWSIVNRAHWHQQQRDAMRSLC